MLVRYARVSTLDLQRDALRQGRLRTAVREKEIRQGRHQASQVRGSAGLFASVRRAGGVAPTCRHYLCPQIGCPSHWGPYGRATRQHPRELQHRLPLRARAGALPLRIPANASRHGPSRSFQKRLPHRAPSLCINGLQAPARDQKLPTEALDDRWKCLRVGAVVLRVRHGNAGDPVAVRH